MIATPREIEVMATTTKVQEKFPLLREASRLARKNSAVNERNFYLAKV